MRIGKKVSSMELVQEIHHLLMDREDTCHRTCFSLQLNGVTLDNFAELKNIDGLADNSVIKVVEEAYTVREARIHVRHVRDLLKSLDPVDAYNGIECNSLSFLTTVAQGDVLGQSLPSASPSPHSLVTNSNSLSVSHTHLFPRTISVRARPECHT